MRKFPTGMEKNLLFSLKIAGSSRKVRVWMQLGNYNFLLFSPMKAQFGACREVSCTHRIMCHRSKCSMTKKRSYQQGWVGFPKDTFGSSKIKELHDFNFTSGISEALNSCLFINLAHFCVIAREDSKYRCKNHSFVFILHQKRLLFRI